MQKLALLSSTATWFRRVYQAYFIVSWTALFSVKAAFLAFFRRLTERFGWIATYWKVVAGFTAASWIYCIIDGFIACPKTGTSARRRF